MSASERRVLIETARAVVNGEPVDWRRLAETHPELGKRLRTMRLLAGLVEVGPDDAGALARGTTWGPLEIRERVGSGSFGEVYRAFDPVLEREVALKIHRQDDVRLQLGEARLLARVRHPNVLAIHGIETHGGRTGMWTDFVAGRTLETIVADEAPIDGRELVRIGRAVCEALAAVHDAGLVHADVKAANVMVESDGRPVLMDFGAGREHAEMPRAGVARPAFGTPLVMAPELLRGERPTVASDLYAVGALLYRLSCGRYPVEATTRRELLDRLHAGSIPPLGEIRPDLPADVLDAIMAALRPDPDARPVTALALATQLVAGDPVVGDRPTTTGTTRVQSAPVFESRFVGRRAEIGEIRRALAERRWVTLTGPGGSGKTRLAHTVTAETAAAYPGGAFWVDLVGTRDAEALDLEVCRVLGVELTGTSVPRDSILSYVAERRVMMVLDNAEHIVKETRTFVDELRAASPGVTVLVTSRARLGGEGECALSVRPLAVPSATARSAAEVLESDAVRLFLVRASTARPSFRLTDTNATDVARICRRVDGIPLGIELAAARVDALGEAELAERLDRSLVLLRDRAGTRRARHETVRALIAWSVDLLSSPARTLLARLSVFAGTFTLVAAEHVCADGEPETTSREDLENATLADPLASPHARAVGGEEIADLLTELCEQSLIAFEPGELPRYRMLALIREHARELLAAGSGSTPRRSGDGARPAAEERARRHHDWYRDLAMRALPELHGTEPVRWLARLDAELENVHEALERPASSDDEIFSRLVLLHGLGSWWRLRARHHDGIRYVSQVRQLPEVRGDTHFRSSLHNHLGMLYHGLGRTGEARAELELAIALHEQRGKSREAAYSRVNLGGVFVETGDHDAARRHLHRAREACESMGDARGLAHALSLLGVSHERAGDDRAAYGFYSEALAIQRRSTEDPLSLVAFLNNVAGSLLRLDRTAEALPIAEEGLDVLRDLGEPSQLAGSLVTYASILLDLERPEACRDALLEVTDIHAELEHPFGLMHTAGTWGSYFVACNAPDAATIAFSFCLAWAEASGMAISELDRTDVDEKLATLRARLGEAHFASASRRGRSLDRAAFLTTVRELARA